MTMGLCKNVFLPAKIALLTLCAFSFMKPMRVSAEFEQQRFVPSKICGSLEDLVNAGCISSRVVRSDVDCALSCLGEKSSCIGRVFDAKTLTCHFLHLCDYASDNMNCGESGLTYVTVSRKECQNRGRFTTKTGVICKCKLGYIGDFCDRMATHCKEIIGFGYNEGEHYAVNINYRGRVQKMMCASTSSYYAIGFLANSGRLSKTFTWEDYEKGYYINERNYWLGLENMQHLLESDNPNSKLKGSVWFEGDIKDYIYYYGFRIADSSHMYSYSYDSVVLKNNDDHGGVELPFEDCFAGNQNIPFSTPDSDNDLDPARNCAGLAGVGWWFGSCSNLPVCNPLGLYVGALPPPATNAHIAIKGINMINSSLAKDFNRIFFTAVVAIP